MRQHLLRFGKWVLLGSSLASGAMIVANCSATGSSPPQSPQCACPGSSHLASTTASKWDYNWDKREPHSLVKPPPKGQESQEDHNAQLEKNIAKAIRHIILIRHGQYNLDGATDADQTLTNLGEKQAKETGKRLKKLGLKFTSLTSSDMARAVQTAKIIQTQIESRLKCKHKIDPMLAEGAPFPPDPPNSLWQPEPHEFWEEGARIEAAFRAYLHRASPSQTQDSYEILVCHGNVIRYFFCRALQLPANAWLRITVNHASLTCLTITPSGRVILTGLGESSHLDPEMVTYT